jgi:GNAT superfamily N-acetyltransferase
MDLAALAHQIRPARDGDADALIALIEACWAEYVPLTFDVETELPELRALASHYSARGGRAWVAEAERRIVGLIAAGPGAAPSTWAVGKLYVTARHRGGGLAHRLVDLAEAAARTAKARRMELWSDTRFARGHAFYESRSYLRSGAIRPLHDSMGTLEYYFEKPLTGLVVDALGPAAAASAERPLAEVLRACVDGGASVSFLPPLSTKQARAFYRARAAEVAAGSRALIVAWLEGVLVGNVMLDWDLPDNQPHRAEIQKLLVHPGARRRSIGRALVLAVEAEGRRMGRRLLVLETGATSGAASLYRALGYNEAGTVPGYALLGDGRPSDAIFMWKALT